MNNEEITQAIIKEVLRLEEDCEHSAKSNFNTESIWSWVHYLIGIPMTLLATLTALYAKENITIFPLTAIVAILAALQTLLAPDKQARSHKIAGDNYLLLRNKARRFREIEIPSENLEYARKKVDILAETRDKLNKETPSPMWFGYFLAKRDIDSGRSKYCIDKVKENK